MKIKLIIISNIILIAAVVLLFILQFSPQKIELVSSKKNHQITQDNANQQGPVETPKDFNYLKIAFVNSDTVSANYLFAQKLQKSLSKKQKSAEYQIKTKYAEYQKMVKEYQQAAEIMGQSEAAEKAQRIALLEQEIMQQEQTLSQNLANEEYSATNDYITKTDVFMQEIGKTLGYDYVLSYRIGGPMLYANPNLDITYKVIELLNKEYSSN